MNFSCGNLVTGVILMLTGFQKHGACVWWDGFKTTSCGYLFMALDYVSRNFFPGGDITFYSEEYWESQFLGRLIRTLGVSKERGVWNSQGGRKDKLFFLSPHSLGLYNNNVSCLRTVFGLNLLLSENANYESRPGLYKDVSCLRTVLS